MAGIRDFLTKVGWKIDNISQAGRVTLYDTLGNALTGTEDSFITVSMSALSDTTVLAMAGHNGVGFTITNMGHANNVVTCEYSTDGIWVAVPAINTLTNNSTLNVTEAGTYTMRYGEGVAQVRLRVSSYTSGTVTGDMNASYASAGNVVIRSFANVYSVVNSSTAQLNAAATFTGAWEADLFWQGCVVNWFADQDLTIVIEQSDDGVTAKIKDTYYYRASSTGQDASTTVNLHSNYHRVLVTNSGSGATTNLVINTYACPNFTSEPRSLTRSGNKKVEVPEKATYRATFNGTPVATATFTLKGSATKLIKVTRIGFSQSATATTMTTITVKKYSVINGGTPVAITGVPLDTRNSAATAICQNWTVTPATQTSVGTLETVKYRSNIPADNFPTQVHTFDFNQGDRGASAIALIGIAQWVGIDVSALLAGADANMWVEWTEE